MSLRMIPEWRSLGEMNCLLLDPVFWPRMKPGSLSPTAVMTCCASLPRPTSPPAMAGAAAFALDRYQRIDQAEGR